MIRVTLDQSKGAEYFKDWHALLSDPRWVDGIALDIIVHVRSRHMKWSNDLLGERDVLVQIGFSPYVRPPTCSIIEGVRILSVDGVSR